jgi:Ala-tRNA(Pro) deacylase
MYELAQRIKSYLDDSHIHYWSSSSWLEASAAGDSVFQSYEVDSVACCQVIAVAGKLAVVAISSDEELDLDEMRRFLNTQEVKVLAEHECQKLFPDCDATAFPALGSVLGMPVYCSPSVLQNKKISFNIGTHDEIIQLETSDFVQLVRPVVGAFVRSLASSLSAAYYW